MLSIPLLFALASCGGAPPPNTGANATSGSKPGDSSASSDTKKPDTTADSDPSEGADTGTPPDKKTEVTTRGPGGGSDRDKDTGEGSPPPPPQAASVVSTTPLSGRLTQQEIADILSKNAAYFNDCYTIGAGKGQEFRGTVTVKATIGPSGSVTVAEVIKSTAKNAKVDACVVTAFKKIKFPAPKDGGTSVITFPMEFQGVEQVR
jgi:TonB family protein